MTPVDSNFNFLCGRPHGAGPPSPVHMRPPEPDPLPLRVDVINGWPHICRVFCKIVYRYIYSKGATLSVLVGLQNTHMLTYTQIHADIYIYIIYTCIHIYIHTHIHTLQSCM